MPPAETSAPAAAPPSYDERLTVPPMFWLALVAIVAVGILEVGSGFTYVVIVPVAVFMIGFFIVPFLISGRTRVQVKDGVLVAGKQELPVMSIAGVTTLDREQTRMRIGPQADPAATLVHKGWISSAVMLRLSNPSPTPYWVVSTRRPEELADAIRSARSYIRATR